MFFILSLILSIIYFLYFFWVTEGLWAELKKGKNNIREDMLPNVSIVVSAHNEESTLPNLIESINNQDYPHKKIQLIVVNDRSKDKTFLILDKLSKVYHNLTVFNINETPIGWAPKKWALSKAVEEAKSDIILQTDADCIPNHNWVKKMVCCFQDPMIGFVSGPAPLTNKSSGLLDKMFELDSLAQDSFSASGLSKGLVFSCTGRNIAFKKEVYEKISGYSEIQNYISGDDDLLMQKVHSLTNSKIHFISDPLAVVESSPPQSINQFINQRLRFASKGLSYYKLKTSLALKIILPILFIVNLLIVICIIKFSETSSGFWLLPFIFKLFGDYIVSYSFFLILKRQWSFSAFAILSILHPFYILFFGFLGPLIEYKWKD